MSIKNSLKTYLFWGEIYKKSENSIFKLKELIKDKQELEFYILEFNELKIDNSKRAWKGHLFLSYGEAVAHKRVVTRVSRKACRLKVDSITKANIIKLSLKDILSSDEYLNDLLSRIKYISGYGESEINSINENSKIVWIIKGYERWHLVLNEDKITFPANWKKSIIFDYYQNIYDENGNIGLYDKERDRVSVPLKYKYLKRGSSCRFIEVNSEEILDFDYKKLTCKMIDPKSGKTVSDEKDYILQNSSENDIFIVIENSKLKFKSFITREVRIEKNEFSNIDKSYEIDEIIPNKKYNYYLNLKKDTIDRVEYLTFCEYKQRDKYRVDESCLSQLYDSPFYERETLYFTSEHYMMAQKAKLFNDKEGYKKILTTKNPVKAKSLGREIQNFDEEIWSKYKIDIVYRANLLKFEQHPKLREFLLNTEDKILVETNPKDTIWGVGLKSDDREVSNPKEWRGDNLLGFILMDIRDFFKKRGIYSYYLSDKEYDDAQLFYSFRAPVNQNGDWGYIDRNANEVIEPQFIDYNFFNDGYSILSHKDFKNYKMVIDEFGNTIIESKYSEIKHYDNDIFFVRDSDKWAIFQKDKVLINFISLEDIDMQVYKDEMIFLDDKWIISGNMGRTLLDSTSLKEEPHLKLKLLLRDYNRNLRKKRYTLPLEDYLALFSTFTSEQNLIEAGIWHHLVKVKKIRDGYEDIIVDKESGYIGWEYPLSASCFNFSKELPVVFKKKDSQPISIGIAIEDLELKIKKR